MTPLPSAASAAAVHATNKVLPRDAWMLVVTNGYKRDGTVLEKRFMLSVWWWGVHIKI